MICYNDVMEAGRMMLMLCTEVTAVVLAGGGSTRMGKNKALLNLGNRTMIERIVEPLKNIFKDITVVTNNPEEYNMLKGVQLIGDCIEIEEKNSLVGLYSGLKASCTSHVFVIACDMPFINNELIKSMINIIGTEDVLIPFVGGHYQPLHAIYKKTCLPEFEKLLEIKCYKIADAFLSLNINKINEQYIRNLDPTMSCFENINTLEQYLELKDNFD